MRIVACFSLWLLMVLTGCQEKMKQVDVLVIGGGASGTTAGIQAARMGAATLIAEEHEWLGGMLTSAGVSAIDGNYKLPGGLWGEFKAQLINYYGGRDSALITGWVSNVLFEPSVGDKIWKKMVAAEKNLECRLNTTYSNIVRGTDGWTVTLTGKDGKSEQVWAKILIDGTELGDVAKIAGVKYDIGMDAREVTGEAIAPENANDIIQDLTYVAVLKDYGKDVTIEKPEGYDPVFFYCTCESEKCTNPKEAQRLWSKERMLEYGKLPNNKYMINWPIEGNDYYVNIIEMTSEERTEALKAAKQFTMCYLYYMQTELGFNTLGLADDEFPTEDRLPFIPYHRESRRIHGLVRFTLNDAAEPYNQSLPLYRTAIGVGDYPVDHHHTRYHGWAELPDLHFYPIPSYGLPLGVMIPQEVNGLIVAEKSISVTNLINGTTRLQPVVMQIGQAAGALAALAANKGVDVKDVPVRDVQDAILDASGYLLPYLDVPVGDSKFKTLQRIGATGILKGKGMNIGWTNQTWINADSVLYRTGFEAGFTEYYPSADFSSMAEIPSVAQIVTLLQAQGGEVENIVTDWKEAGMGEYDAEKGLTRAQFAWLLDKYLDPFHTVAVDVTGRLVQKQ